MKAISEAEFTKQILQLARLQGWRSAHFRPARRKGKDGKDRWETAVQGDGKGWPDLVLLKGSWLIVAELKVGKGKLTFEQTEWIEAFRLAGVAAFVWRPEDWPAIERVMEYGPGAW